MTYEEKEKSRKRRRFKQLEKRKWEQSKERRPFEDVNEEQFRKYKKLREEPLDEEEIAIQEFEEWEQHNLKRKEWLDE